jgi:hypothetical protein
VYVRKKTARGRDYYQIVQGMRDGPRVRQRVIVALGTEPDPAAALEAMRRELAALEAAHKRGHRGCPRSIRRAGRIRRLESRIRRLGRILEEKTLETAPRRTREDDRRVAVHEAGHAVVRFELGGAAVGPISIVDDGFSPGRVMQKARPPGLRRPPLARELAAIFAGGVAEALEWPDRFGGKELISPGDHALAMKLVAGLGPERREMRAGEGLDMAKATLGRPEVWAQVQALAARLVKDRELSPLQAKRLCRKARREFLAR